MKNTVTHVSTKFPNRVWVFEDEDTHVAVRKSCVVNKKMIVSFFKSSRNM